MNTYAIISVGGKQYRVREGEKLLVDRLAHGEGKTFNPAVLLVGGGGAETQISPKDFTVTARVVADDELVDAQVGVCQVLGGGREREVAAQRDFSAGADDRTLQQGDENEEIDILVLADDLPINAYLDDGFDAWLDQH